MMPLKEAFGKYWLAYYLVYVVGVGAFLRQYRVPLLSGATADDTRLYLLAAVFGVSAGIALSVTILMEVLITMVLLAPRVWRHAVNQGKQEGLREGRQEGRQETQQRWEEWNRRRMQAEARGERFEEPPPGE